MGVQSVGTSTVSLVAVMVANAVPDGSTSRSEKFWRDIVSLSCEGEHARGGRRHGQGVAVGGGHVGRGAVEQGVAQDEPTDLVDDREPGGDGPARGRPDR